MDRAEKKRVFIVEDDPVIAGAMAKRLASWGCQAKIAEDFSKILAEFAAFDPHIALIDIVLPFYNGFHWCQEIRKISKAPIAFISSASDNMNIVMAMNIGADDFIAKPFDLDVLTAKVMALLRRAYDFTGQTSIIEHGGAMLNMNDATVSYDGQKIELTKNEYRILYTLMENRGAIVSRDTLMEKLWESDSFVDENTLSVNVTRLRKKLEGMGLYDYILTRKGAGYIVK